MVGDVVRHERTRREWTLDDLSARTGVSRSTLSKIDNCRILPSRRVLKRLCAGLELGADELYASASGPAGGEPSGRLTLGRAASRPGGAPARSAASHLCADIVHKRITPLLVDVGTQSVSVGDEGRDHAGDEFVYVIEGAVVLHTKLFEPEILRRGDSSYFDRSMRHAFSRSGSEPARLILALSEGAPRPGEMPARPAHEGVARGRAGLQSRDPSPAGSAPAD